MCGHRRPVNGHRGTDPGQPAQCTGLTSTAGRAEGPQVVGGRGRAAALGLAIDPRPPQSHPQATMTCHFLPRGTLGFGSCVSPGNDRGCRLHPQQVWDQTQMRGCHGHHAGKRQCVQGKTPPGAAAGVRAGQLGPRGRTPSSPLPGGERGMADPLANQYRSHSAMLRPGLGIPGLRVRRVPRGAAES